MNIMAFNTKTKYYRKLFKSSSGLGSTPLTATAAMPGTSMKIYYGEPVEGDVAESVKIGDPLSLVVSIDSQGTSNPVVCVEVMVSPLGSWMKKGLNYLNLVEYWCPQH